MNGLSKEFWHEMASHAEREYPSECCGLLLGHPEGDVAKLWPCRNVQDQYRRRDPENFPRTAANAYLIDPLQLLEIQKWVRQNGMQVRVIYHSHPDAAPEFSAEDERQALWAGEPVYAEAEHLVLSVQKGKFQSAALFGWSPEMRRFAKKGEWNRDECLA